ncbi:MAG: hypothetical protein IJJ25_07350 [Lachnospiraceae bacterium]|nr:hypothetical protein [Lachnospiraceae bacterium]
MNNLKIQLLDCTLRDGGQGLEASYRAGISEVRFTKEIISESRDHLVKSDVDIVELGYIEKSRFIGSPFANYFSIEDISRFLPFKKNSKQMYVALFTGPDTDPNMIPERNPSLVDGTRVILRYSELEKSVAFCEMLSQKGYNTFVQPMLTMRYTEDELEMLIERANRMHAYALYFVDSFGYMQPEDVERLFRFYDERLDKKIRIGFHAHNNLNLAFSNAKEFIRIAGDRPVIVDSCAIGMGQGAGNLQTEIILPHLNRHYGKQYVFDEILEVCDLIEPLTSYGQWGYSVDRSLPALYNTAYKYAMIMRMKMKFSYPKINYVLQNIPNELRHRYTDENLKSVLDSLANDHL